MSAITVLTAEHAAELAALAAQVADYPWRAAQFVDSCAAGHQLLGLRDGAGALLGFAVWSLVLDEAELLDIGVAPTARPRQSRRRDPGCGHERIGSRHLRE